jgi:transcriptional repressor NF-X1
MANVGTSRRSCARLRLQWAVEHGCWTLKIFPLNCVGAWAAKSAHHVITDAWRAASRARTTDPAQAARCAGTRYPPAARASAAPSPTRSRSGSRRRTRAPLRACVRAPALLPCHPGPCPPCAVTTNVPCHYAAHVRAFRCSHLAPGNRDALALSRGEMCRRKLACGNHECPDVCHTGASKPCEVKVAARCFCGKEERKLGCEGGDVHDAIAFSGEAHEEL